MPFNTQYAHKKLTVYKFLAIDILYSQKSIDFKMLLEISTRIQLRQGRLLYHISSNY